MFVIVFFLFYVPDLTAFTYMLVFHFRLAGKVFSVVFPLPIWWAIILISFVELTDPENIGI